MKYLITYNGNGATSGTVPANQTKTYDVAITLATNSGTLAKTGYNFAGWNTNSAGTATNYAVGASYATNNNLTLYAKWVPLPDLTAGIPSYIGTVSAGTPKNFSADITSTLPINSAFNNIFQISTKENIHLPANQDGIITPPTP